MVDRVESFYYLPPSPEGEVTIQDMSAGLEDGRKISVIIPVYDEKENVRSVVKDLYETFTALGEEAEVILVDDGSTDGTAHVLHLLEKEYPVKVFTHEMNLGKTAAMMTGFRHASGDYIILMDGDGQFLAKDIAGMVEKLDQGYDIVNGWGKKRESLAKIIPSLVYNGISRRLFGLPVHQFNLGFKAFRRETVEGLVLRKDEHRYILPLLKEKGFTITEAPVEYLPRQNGKSKFGATRIPLGIMDMISLKIELVLGDRPFRVFGLASCALLSAGVLLGLYAGCEWVQGRPSGLHLGIAVMLFFSAMNLLFTGYAVEAAKCPRK